MHDGSLVTFDRGTTLGCAGVVVGVVALLMLVYTNPAERLRTRFFPPGSSVPVAELRDYGMGAGRVSVAASTSFDALRQTLLGDRPCPVPVTQWSQACWGDVQVPAGTLLVATVPTGCGNREWYGWTNGSTLTIDLVTWGCIHLGGPADARPQPNYALLGVPLSRLPHGRLLVDVADSGVPPVPVTVP